MRIQESDIRLSSRHERESRHEVEIRGENSFRAFFQEASAAGAGQAEGERERVTRLLQSLVDAILAALDGKKCRTGVADCRSLPEPAESPRSGGEFEWTWEMSEKIVEHERTRVEGKGVVRTADGKTIDFSLDVDMCRDFSCERTYVDKGKVVLRDPLVINFDGKAAELTGERFDFDLDADGKAERVPGLGGGCGYICLDRNGNGRVDDGGELFGARSGDGFAELARLDSDGNGWLDEADPAFADLRIWGGGKEAKELAGLGEKGVGALWLGSARSPFALKDEANGLLGEIRASGLYLGEDGRVGSLQQVDLAVESEGAK